MTWRFHPPIWAIVAAALGLSLFCSLSLWQWQRGQAKQQLLDAEIASAKSPAQVFDPTQTPNAQKLLHVVVEGRYDPTQQLLLDNQSHQQRPGYEVWSLLRLSTGQALLVNRGWIPLTAQRRQLPALPLDASPRRLSGRWQALPKAGMASAPAPCTVAPSLPMIVNYPTARDLRCLLGVDVLDGQLLLDADQPDGFVRAWRVDNGFPPSRHYGYALQWAALALTLLVLFVKLNLKRNHADE